MPVRKKELSPEVQARRTIMKELKPVLHRMDTIESRLEFRDIVLKYTENIESCLTKVDNVNVLIKRANNKMVKGVIKYDTRIGSDSKYGIAYKNIGMVMANQITFASKIIGTNSSTSEIEIKMLSKMNEIAINKISPHMPIIYRIVYCDEPLNLNLSKIPDKLIGSVGYYILINELASYDLAKFLLKPRGRDAVYESVLMQIVIALRTFHKYTGYIHNDSHWGNFLIHEIKSGGYWHYRIDDTDIYVPNHGYLVVLWDPGLATRIDRYDLPIIDYDRIFGILKDRTIRNEKHVDFVPKKVIMRFESMVKQIERVEYNYLSRKRSSFAKDGFKEYFNKNTEFPFKYIKIHKQAAELESIPKRIINDKPYMI